MTKFHVMIAAPGQRILSSVQEADDPKQWLRDKVLEVLHGDEDAMLEMTDVQDQPLIVLRDALRQSMLICVDPTLITLNPPRPGPLPGPGGPGGSVIHPGGPTIVH